MYPFSQHPSGSISYASDIETGFYTLDLVLPVPPESGSSAFGYAILVILLLAALGLFGFWLWKRYRERSLTYQKFGDDKEPAYAYAIDNEEDQ